jgi:hypothetical protein
MNRLLSLLAMVFIVSTAFSQTPCDGASGTIVAAGYSTTNDGYYQQCVGGNMTFTVEDVVLLGGGNVAEVHWYINGDLHSEDSGLSYTITYEFPLLLEITAVVLSSTGCSLSLQLDMPVAYLNYPSPAFEEVNIACFNEQGVQVLVNNIETSIEPSLGYAIEGAALPDGVGVPYTQNIVVSGNSKPYVTECTDIDYILLNMEHSYAGDVSVQLTCPNGTSVYILQQSNGLGSSYFGEPIDNDQVLSPGVGYDYTWSMEGNGYMTPAGNGNSIPSGTYLPAQSFCGFIGCPVNGTWILRIQDHYALDNGHLFYGTMAVSGGVYTGGSYEYESSSSNQFEWTSDEFDFTNQQVLQSTLHPNNNMDGTFSYSYTNPAGCTGTAVHELEFIEMPYAVSLSDDFLFDSSDNNTVFAVIDTLTSEPIVIDYHWSPAYAVVNSTALTTEVAVITEDTYITFSSTMPAYWACSFTDSVLVSFPTNAVVLTVFHDANENGIFDDGENTIPQLPIDADIIGTVYTSSNGTILTSLEDATTFEINVDASLWELTTPAFVEVDETEWSGYALQYYFGVKPTANTVVDIEVSLSGITPLCNSTSYAQAIIFNNGNYYPGGELVIDIDPLYTFVSSNPAPTSINGNELTYVVSALSYHQMSTIHLVLQNPAETAFNQTAVHEIAGYYRIDDNTLSDVQDYEAVSAVILCAYDPNDKITHRGIGVEGFILPNTSLEYTINFQNIGNAPATDVVVIDEITDLLDITSLQPIAWSHDFVLSVVGNTATFRFDDIQLLGVEQDEELSKGFVRFKIKQQPDLAPGTEIENTAEIFFDNNEPIITNTALNTISITIGTDNLDIPQLLVYPNPATSVIFWNDVQYKLTAVINAMGQRIEGVSSNRNGQYNTSSLSAGMYVLQFENEDGHIIRQSLIIQ